MIGCGCYKCKKEVDKRTEFHFVSEDGKILCDKCSIGITPCSEGIKNALIEQQKKDYGNEYERLKPYKATIKN